MYIQLNLNNKTVNKLAVSTVWNDRCTSPFVNVARELSPPHVFELETGSGCWKAGCRSRRSLAALELLEGMSKKKWAQTINQSLIGKTLGVCPQFQGWYKIKITEYNLKMRKTTINISSHYLMKEKHITWYIFIVHLHFFYVLLGKN